MFSVMAFADLPVSECPLVKQSPVIDGRLDDAAWTTAVIGGEIYDAQSGGKAIPGMTFRVCTNGKMLFLAFEMIDPEPSKLSVKNLGRDKLDFREDIEIFLAPFIDQPQYYHFGVDPAGSDWDNMGMGGATDNNYGWVHKETVTEKGWISEMAIPLTELGRSQGAKAGDQLGLNIARTYRGGTLHAWSPPGGNFHNRGAFGTLIIGKFSDGVQGQNEKLSTQFKILQAKTQSNSALKSEIPGLQSSITQVQDFGRTVRNRAAWQAFQKKYDNLVTFMDRLSLTGMGLKTWEVNPWQLPFSEVMPAADSPEITELNFTVFQDEYLTRAIAVTNATEKFVAFRVLASELVTAEGLEKIAATKHIKLFEAEEIGLKNGGRQRDPLPEIGLEKVVKLAPGYNSMIWLTLNTYGLKPGWWIGSLTLKPTINRELEKTIRVKINVLPVKFPQGPKPYSYNWAFYGDSKERYTQLCIQDQKEHFTNVHPTSLDSTGLRALKFDGQGRIIENFDFSGLEQYIDMFGIKDQIYILNARYEWFPELLGGQGKVEGIGLENFTKWAKALRKFFESKGMTVKNFAWYACDEPLTEKQAEGVANLGKLLQATDREQQIFVTVYNAISVKALEIMAPYVNVWSPSTWCSEEQLAFIDKQKARHFSYCVLNRTGGPYVNYRLDCWRAYYRGYEAVGFWAYNDSGGTSVWDDYDWVSHDYSVIYEGTDKPVGSVRWEAHRQGILDYRLLDWVKAMAQMCPDKILAKNATLLTQKAVNMVLTDGRATVADQWIDRLRVMAVKLLKASEEIPRHVQMVDVPVCLTGNAGSQFANLDTGGCYTYEPALAVTEEYGERCGEAQGAINFKGKNARSGKQQGNKADGDLTDGLLGYPMDWCIYTSSADPSRVTFDLQKSYTLSHVILNHDVEGFNPVIVCISETGETGSWTSMGSISAGSPGKRTFDQGFYFDLKKAKSRYVKLEIHGRYIRLGEVKIFGWDEDKE
jgi:hypothetical protein